MVDRLSSLKVDVTLGTSGYKEGAQAVTQANAAMVESGKKVDAQVTSTEVKYDKLKASLERSTRSFQTSTEKFTQVQALWQKGIERGVVTQEEANKRLSVAAQRYGVTTQALDANTKAAGLNRMQMLTLQYTFNDVVASLASGISPMTILLQQGGQITQAWGGVGNTFRALLNPLALTIGSLAALAGGAAALSVSAERAERTLKGLETGLTATGRGASLSRDQLQGLIAQANALPQVTRASATEIVSLYSRTRQIGTESLADLIAVTDDYAAATGTTATEAAKALADGMKQPLTFANQLHDQFGLLTLAQYRQIDAAVKGGEAWKAQGIILAELEGRFQGLQAQSLTPFQSAVDNLSNAWDSLKKSFSETSWATAIVEAATRATNALAKLMGSGETGGTPTQDQTRSQLESWKATLESRGGTSSTAQLRLARIAKQLAQLDAPNSQTSVTTTDTRSLSDQLKAETEAAKASSKAQDDLQAVLDRVEATRTRLNEAVDAQLRSLTDEREGLGMTERARSIHAEVVKAENVARREGLSLTDAQITALTQEAGALYDAKEARDELKKSQEEQARAYEKQQQEITRVTERTADQITDAFVDAFDGSKSPLQSFKDFFIRTMKEMAANAIVRSLIQPIVSGVLGGGGSVGIGSGALGGASGSGSLLSSGSSLLGLGNSAYSLLGGTLSGVGSSSVINGIGAQLGFGNLFTSTGVSTGFTSASLSSVLGGAGLGFGAGTLLNGLIGGNQTGGTIGSGVGALGGAVIGSMILPGVGTVLGGLLGGSGGGVLGGLIKIGGGKKHPAGETLINASGGRLAVGSTGGKHVNNQVTIDLASQAVSQGNTILDTYGLTLGALPNRFGIGQGQYYGGRARTVDDALNQLFNSGAVTGNATQNTVLGRTRGQGYQAAVAGLDFAKLYDQLLKLPKPLTDVETAMKALRDEADATAAKATEYGLSSAAVFDAYRDRLNQETATAIKQIEDPLGYALEQFDKSAAARIETAKKFGADVVQIEKLNALEREKIIEQSGKATLKTMSAQLKEWLDGQKLGSTSTLTPYERLQEAQRQFDSALTSARQGGDIGALTSAADTLLGAGQDALGGATTAYATLSGMTRSSLEGLGRALNLPGFATGGSFMVGGMGGTDSQVVAFRASPNERVTVETPDQQGGVIRALAQQTVVLAERLERLEAALKEGAATKRLAIQNAIYSGGRSAA